VIKGCSVWPKIFVKITCLHKHHAQLFPFHGSCVYKQLRLHNIIIFIIIAILLSDIALRFNIPWSAVYSPSMNIVMLVLYSAFNYILFSSAEHKSVNIISNIVIFQTATSCVGKNDIMDLCMQCV